MSQPFHPPSSPGQQHADVSFHGLPPNPYAVPPNPYAVPPAHGGAPTSMAQQGGLNAWLAGGLGALAGIAVTALFGMVLWFSMGYPMPWEGPDDWVDEWVGRVEVGSDGSVVGLVLADAVRDLGGGGYYEEVFCPATPRVAQDVTTVCRVDDGYEQYSVVVLFLDSDGRFEAAEFYSE